MLESGLNAHFLFEVFIEGVMRKVAALEKTIVPLVEGLGYEFVGLQVFPQGRRSLIRLFIDKQGGVNIDDCERVSRQVNAVLGVESPISEDYLLEVSSPGLDRLLFTADQLGHFLGKQVVIRLSVPMAGKRNFTGLIESVHEDMICIQTEGQTIKFSFSDVAEARLVPEW